MSAENILRARELMGKPVAAAYDFVEALASELDAAEQRGWDRAAAIARAEGEEDARRFNAKQVEVIRARDVAFALAGRVRAMAEVPCATRRGMTMRCMPGDKCSFCRCRDLLANLDQPSLSIDQGGAK